MPAPLAYSLPSKPALPFPIVPLPPFPVCLTMFFFDLGFLFSPTDAQPLLPPPRKTGRTVTAQSRRRFFSTGTRCAGYLPVVWFCCFMVASSSESSKSSRFSSSSSSRDLKLNGLTDGMW